MTAAVESALKSRACSDGAFFPKYSVFKNRVLTTEYSMTMAGFPGGNDHGPEHIKRVLANLATIIGPKPLRHLNCYELFLAMMGVLYHDIGILRGRAEHAAMSAKLLADEDASYLFDDIDKGFLSSIVLNHSSTANIPETSPSDQYVKGFDVRPRMLSALVRLADELDEDVRRADPQLRVKLDLPKQSEFYWRFNKCIRGVKIDRARNEIVFNIEFGPGDIGLREDGVEGSFVDLCIKKLLKVNRELMYCNRFLPDGLKLGSLHLHLQPIPDLLPGATRHIILEDRPDFENIRGQFPPELLADSKRLDGAQSGLAPSRTASTSARDLAPINGYKLFFYRTRKRLSMKELSSLSGIKANTIYQIEKLGKREGSRSFRKVPRADLAALEQALSCIGRLEGGQTDDFLATFLMYYNVNYKARQGSANEQSNYVPDTKAVVFDFGGTLTKPGFAHSTWERMWLASGYTVKDAGKLLLQYRNQEINHQQWCDETCARLRERRFSQRDLRHLIEGIEPVDGLATALQSLVRRHIELFIVSGNVRDIIAGVLGETFKMFREVRANEMSFDDDGVIKEIRGHRFDFEGKAEFITGVAEDLGCNPLEVLFVGNSLNDVWAGRSGARTLLVNPAAVDHTDTFVWNDCIQEMARLEEILPYSERRSK